MTMKRDKKFTPVHWDTLFRAKEVMERERTERRERQRKRGSRRKSRPDPTCGTHLTL